MKAVTLQTATDPIRLIKAAPLLAGVTLPRAPERGTGAHCLLMLSDNLVGPAGLIMDCIDRQLQLHRCNPIESLALINFGDRCLRTVVSISGVVRRGVQSVRTHPLLMLWTHSGDRALVVPAHSCHPLRNPTPGRQGTILNLL